MRKPALTNKVLRGLDAMQGAVNAEPYAILLGVDSSDNLSPEEKKTMSDFDRACDWILAMHTWKASKEGATL